MCLHALRAFVNRFIPCCYFDTVLLPMLQMGNDRYPSTTACCDAALVTVRWLGFHRIWQGSGEVFDSIDLFLPDVQFGTQVSTYSLKEQ